MGCTCSNPKINILIRDYEKIEEIGEGGFSKIYRAKKSDRLYAMKEFNKEKEKEYQEEKSILKKFEHNNIVKYIDSFTIEEKKDDIIIDKKFYIILEYCKSDLRKLINNYNNDLINPQLIYIIIKDICLGLKEIHSQNIIHRDIKPENILIGEDNKIKITDFNISKIMNDHHTPQVGTLPYIAPEILKGEKYDNKADLFSFGVIICDLCKYSDNQNNLILSIDKDKEVTIDSNYDKELEKLINGLLKNNPKERYDVNKALDDINKLEMTFQNNNIFNNENLDEISKNILERKKESEIGITVNIEKNDQTIYILDNTDEHNHFQALNNDNTELFIYNKNYKTLDKREFKKRKQFPNKGTYKIILKIKDNLTDTSYMFSKCKNIIKLDLSYFNTSKINKMSNMFSYMNLKNIDLPIFNPTKIETMKDMFAYCNSLKNIKLRFFNTSNIVDMRGMFRYCKNLKNVKFSSSNDINVEKMDDMFDSCENLKEVDLSIFILSKKTTVENIFHKCTNLYKFGVNDINDGKQKMKNQINKEIDKEIVKEIKYVELSIEKQKYWLEILKYKN